MAVARRFIGNALSIIDPGRLAERLQVARELGETSLSLLVDPTLSDNDIDKVIDGVTDVMMVASA